MSRSPRFLSAALMAASLPLLTAALPAEAASLPAIKASATNAVPACATPGRLMAFMKSRNPRMNPRYSDIATYYMRHGEELGLRWDIAYFQMLVETDSLKYTGDVKPKQNNFAGLGATGNGVRGESFEDVSSGVRAHLEHVLMYSGAYVENPVAQRTRKVQEWRVLTKWQRSLPKPITFTHLTRKWSPGDRSYSRDIKTIADVFYARFCDIADPAPELLAAARGNSGAATASASSAPPATTAEDLVEKVIAKSKSETADRSALGAGSIAAQPEADTTAKAKSNIKVLNADTKPAVDEAAKRTAQSASVAGERTAALAGGALKSAAGAVADKKPKPDADAKAKAPDRSNCRVWTASYGGSRAIIIKAVNDGRTNYTVLDVNKGREKREVSAYIAAYAKGGKQIAEFDSPQAALDKAFSLCPEN